MHRLHRAAASRLCARRRVCTRAPDNYYALLGVRESFRVDEADLSARFRQQQRHWHPDKFGASSPAEQRAAAAMSARLNAAYAALRAPDARAKHLLRLRAPGVDVGGDALDPGFLAWVVDFRQGVAEAEGDRARLAQFRGEAEDVMDVCLEELREAFEKADWQRAAEGTAKLQYLRRIKQAIEDHSSD